jgi:hypothetical protein
MPNIYDQHAAAFKNVQAFTAFKLVDGQVTNVIKVAFKFPKDGAGRLYCYLHLIGTPMVRGFANGYGYDKRSAAIMSAADKLDMRAGEGEFMPEIEALHTALQNCESKGYDGALREAGFTILTAV